MKLVLVGAGGHARSVLAAARTSGLHEVVACTDPRPEVASATVDGIPIVGDDSFLPEILGTGVPGACIGVGGARDNHPRSDLFDRLVRVGFELPPIVHGAAIIAESAE